MTRLAVEGNGLVATCRPAEFATFAYCRRVGIERPTVLYAHPILVSTDNALIAIEMSPHTFNGGLIYFASGGFEEADRVGDTMDVERNMDREVLEETGLDLGAATREPGYRFLTLENGTMVGARFRLDLTAEEVESRINAHISGNSTSEIVRPVVIRGPGHSEKRFAPQMPPLISWHFQNPWVNACS